MLAYLYTGACNVNKHIGSHRSYTTYKHADFVCIHINKHSCMLCRCTHIHEHIYTYTDTQRHTHTHPCIHIPIHIYTYMYMYRRTHTCMHIHMRLKSTYTYTYTYTYTCTYTYTYMRNAHTCTHARRIKVHLVEYSRFLSRARTHASVEVVGPSPTHTTRRSKVHIVVVIASSPIVRGSSG